jgi:hypothetical protein
VKKLLLALLLAFITPVWAEEGDEEVRTTRVRGGENPQIEGVDIPTAEILDPATFSTTFRFYTEGGITSRLLIGPFKMVNLGIYFDAQRVIGGGEPHMTTPSVFFKLRFFDGSDLLPALALGYDNQGYLYKETHREYLHQEKGLYLVGSHEILLPNMDFHAGVNIPKVEEGRPHGFVGLTYKIVPAFALMAEYDNIRNAPENRGNLGGRFWVTPFFNVDVAARNVGRRSDRGAERIVRLNYVGHFPF